MIDDAKYAKMRDAGASPEAVYLQAREDGMGSIDAMVLIRKLFNLSLIDAKEVSICAYGEYKSLSEYQETLADALENAFKDLDENNDKYGR